MNGTAFAMMGHEVTWAAVVGGVAILVWLVFAAMALLGKTEEIDIRLIAGSIVFAVLSFIAFDGMALVRSRTAANATEAAAVAAKTSHASCAAVQPGMSAAQLEARLGKPDEIRPNEEVRGPGATLWVYRDSRCAIALFDGVVELTE
jgi:hypothetical protein